MDSIDDLLPALRLLLIVNVSLAGESQPPLGDGGRFGENESCSSTLAVVFCDKVGGNSVVFASHPGESAHDDAVLEGVLAQLDLIAPKLLH